MKDAVIPPQADLRAPDEVMRLARMGAMFPSRISFLRVMIRRLAADKSTLKRPVWHMDEQGYGHAVYTLDFGGFDYSLVAFSQPLAPENRSDRVIATAWDAAFVLYDGVPSKAEIDRIAKAAPKQEAGRFTERDLVLSRANKSVRLWSYVTDCLQKGQQPDAQRLIEIGYLMRTTAVYGNGKFGIADRALYADRPGMEMSFMAEMLTVWMIREFTVDLISHVGGQKLAKPLAEGLGIGNATGLGMAPFLVTHPVLLNNWMMVRETALARVRAVEHLDDATRQNLLDLATRAQTHLASWHVPEDQHQARINALRQDWETLSQALPKLLEQAHPLDQVLAECEGKTHDLQELAVSWAIEAFPDLVDGLAECLNDPFGGTDFTFPNTDALKSFLGQSCQWALTPDYDAPQNNARFWYVSEEKLEPRLGMRHEEPGAELESPLDIARRFKACHADLPTDPTPLADFLTAHPEHLMAVERAQILQTHPYSEIRDNLIAQTCLPIDMLRAKLSFFGATRFDPKSDLWTRVTLAQGAPLAEDLNTADADNWWLPTPC